MQYLRGGLIDHLHVTVRDLPASTRFYSAILQTLGIPLVELPEVHALSADELWVTDQGALTGRMHFAFQARDRGAVDRFHAAGLAAGGRDNGPPGERQYHPGYYAAYLLDPDGNNVEAVHHGPARRSAEAVEITPDG
jgi:catechol 2,3-dioxygenase-like lactoylglutathione lyase family enzyme